MTFRGIIISEPGGPEVLTIFEDTIPEPAPDEVRIRVQAAGVAFGDVIAREGLSDADAIPYTPGYDVVGVIDKVGDDVEDFLVGQRVAALMDFGGYTEILCRPAVDCVPVPQELDPVEAVAVVLNGLTAYQMLHRVGRTQPGERILVHGAAGGVGSMLLQLGKRLGADLIGTASKAKHDVITALGGQAIDYRSEDFVEVLGQSVDVVFDGIGGPHWQRSYDVLRDGGRMIVYGRIQALDQGRRDEDSLEDFEANMPAFSPMDLFMGGKTIAGYYVTLFKRLYPAFYREDMAHLFDLLLERKIEPVIGATFPLEEAPEAHLLLNQSGVSGKIVLTME